MQFFYWTIEISRQHSIFCLSFYYYN